MARTRRAVLVILVTSAVTVFSPLPQAVQTPNDSGRPTGRSRVVAIPFVKWTLPNGLTVIVHEDHRTPFVCIGVTYHVGSQDEPQGRRGFAHLFEHLMVQGSSHSREPYMRTAYALGASDVRGSTFYDRTEYAVELPSVALERALWLEADRMGFLLDAVDDAAVHTQREQVWTERAGREAGAGIAVPLIAQNTFPYGHPYSWSIHGDADDLAHASLQDVRDWYRSYYGPSNATLVVSGDVNAPAVQRLVEQYFGGLPPGPPLTRKMVATPALVGEHRQVVEARVAEPRLMVVWNVPAAGSREAVLLAHTAHVLAGSGSSRLTQRLVRELRVVTAVDAGVDERELASQFVVSITCASGAACDRADRELEREIVRLRELGPTMPELAAAKAARRMMLARATERIGYGDIARVADYRGKADILSRGQVLLGRPDAYVQEAEWAEAATPRDIQRSAQRWLGDGVYKLRVDPYLATSVPTSAPPLDRSRPPDVHDSIPAKFPAVSATVLSNGMQLRLVSEPHLTLTRLTLVIDGGVRADPPERSGLTGVVMAMLAEGTRSRSAAGIRASLDAMGTKLAIATQPDVSSLGVTVLREDVSSALAMLGDLVINPAFSTSVLERVTALAVANVEQDRLDTNLLRILFFRILPEILYGSNSPYGRPFSGTGTTTTLQSITRDDLVRYQQAWFTPNNATLIAVGSLDIAALKPLAERAFGAWQSRQLPPARPEAPPHRPAHQAYLIDRPGAPLAGIVLTSLMECREPSRAAVCELFNYALGQRLEVMDTFGAYGRGSSWAANVRTQRPWTMTTSVPSGRAGAAVQEMLAQFRAVTRDRPITADEFERARSSLLRMWAGWWSDPDVLTGWVSDGVALGFDKNHYADLAEGLRRASVGQVSDVVSALNASPPVLIVIGDRTQLEPQLRRLELGDLHVVSLAEQ